MSRDPWTKILQTFRPLEVLSLQDVGPLVSQWVRKPFLAPEVDTSFKFQSKSCVNVTFSCSAFFTPTLLNFLPSTLELTSTDYITNIYQIHPNILYVHFMQFTNIYQIFDIFDISFTTFEYIYFPQDRENEQNVAFFF